MILASVPVPHDIPLPLPVDRTILQAVIIVLFLAHIVFINLTVGGSILALVFEALGRKRPDFDTLAHEITKTITVNKSMGVVLGVGPLLAINVMYTLYFYSANALTGYVWISIVPLVAVAFLFMYAYKYSWDRLANAKALHMALGAIGVALFLFIPFIFLANINLMLFPDKWTQVRGFLSAVTLPNVLPRYIHFLLACLALTALFLLAYFTRAGYPVETRFQKLDRAGLRRLFYAIAFGTSLLQLAAGPLVLFTLPKQGVSVFLYVIIGTGVTFAITMLALMWWEMISARQNTGRFYVPIVALLMLTGSCMGFGRHVYREQATLDHRMAVQKVTQDQAYSVVAAAWRAKHGVVQENLPLGQRVFRDSCSSCHAVDHVLVGPPIQEIAQIYKGDPAGIVRWAKNPGKKRTNFPAMPALAFPDAHLMAAAEYMLQLGAPTTKPASGPS